MQGLLPLIGNHLPRLHVPHELQRGGLTSPIARLLVPGKSRYLPGLLVVAHVHLKIMWLLGYCDDLFVISRVGTKREDEGGGHRSPRRGQDRARVPRGKGRLARRTPRDPRHGRHARRQGGRPGVRPVGRGRQARGEASRRGRRTAGGCRRRGPRLLLRGRREPEERAGVRGARAVAAQVPRRARGCQAGRDRVGADVRRGCEGDGGSVRGFSPGVRGQPAAGDDGGRGGPRRGRRRREALSGDRRSDGGGRIID